MEDYPGITKAALLVAYSNGGTNRTRSEEQMLRELERFLTSPFAGHPSEILSSVDTWLMTLSETDFETVCDGDQNEAEKILASAPPFTDAVLNDYFEEVC